MSLILLFAGQALGPEITTFHPLPPKEQRQKELQKAQGLPEAQPKPAAAEAPAAAQPEPPKPPAEEIKVTSVRLVPPDANVIWVPLNAPKPAKPEPEEVPAPAPAPVPSEPPATAAAPTPVQPPQTSQVETGQQPLQITCFGGGTADKKKIVSTWGSSSFSGSVGTTPFHGSGDSSSWTVLPQDRQFSEQVDVRLFTGDDRIRMPRTMLPPIHGGSAGWFKLKNVVADARSIRASAAVSLLNNPKVFIDRVTGTISISGKSGDYSGQCEVIDASKAKF